MEALKTTARIHPLMAVAAVSVIIVSLAGTAAVTGVLPSSHSAPEAQPLANVQTNPAYAASALTPTSSLAAAPHYVQPVSAGYVQPVSTQYVQAAPAPAPVVIKETIIREVPAKPRVVHHTKYVRDDGYYAPARRHVAQPNYVAIGTGAVVGGLLGHQVGNGNGRSMATIAGVIGGGMLGNQIANQR